MIAELTDRVKNAQIFTKLDLKDGFHLISIRKGEEWKTAFRTRYGLSEYKVMSFGQVNAPATFQTMMNKILGEFLDDGVVVYIDDNFIYSKDPEDHTTLVRKVLQRLRDLRMALSLEKSLFQVKAVDFIGYVIATDGVTMNEKQVETITAWKPPTSVREVQIFMDFANFYGQFIKNFPDICTPITNLTRGDKTKFVGGRDQQDTFEYLKRCFTTAPILCHFHQDCDTVVETDASDYALGCILPQFQEKRLHPVALHSRKLNSQNKTTIFTTKNLSLSSLPVWSGNTVFKEQRNQSRSIPITKIFSTFTP